MGLRQAPFMMGTEGTERPAGQGSFADKAGMTCVLGVMGELEEKEVPNVLSSLSVRSTGLCWERSWNRHCLPWD